MRDEFGPAVKAVIAARVAHRCSNPQCRAATSGPGSDNKASVNVGVAAHITAAAPGGARFDATMSSEDRSATSNGLWTCQTCSKLIDSDTWLYSVDLLRRWKTEAEERAAQMIAGGLATVTEPLDLAIPSLDGEAALLSYASTAVPQIGRAREMAELQGFLDDDRQFSWWPWAGPAGAGKSRLAVELSRAVFGRWHAGFLREAQQSRLADTRAATPTLVVVDYAAQRSEWLSDALFALTQRSSGHKVRVLVLERDASGPWWDTMQRHHRLEEAGHVAAASHGLPRFLGGLSRDELRVLIRAVAAGLSVEFTATNVEDIADHAEEIDPQRGPLFGYVATLDWLDANGVSAGRDGALRRLVTRADSQMTHRLLNPSSVSRARNARTLGTVLGGLGVDVYASIVESAALPPGLLPGVHEDLPAVPLGELLDGLRPDILGELFVLDRLAREGVDRLSVQRLLQLGWNADPAAYGTFVARAAGDHVEHSHLVDLLRVDDESADPSAWAALAADVVPMLRRSDHPALVWLLARLEDLRRGAESPQLGELAVTARFRAANLLLVDEPGRANELLTGALSATDPAWPVRASILNNRGISWISLGHPDLALEDYNSVIVAETATDEMRACALNNRADIRAEHDPVASIADRTAVLDLPATTYDRRYIALIRRARTRFLTGNQADAFTDVDIILATDDIAPEQKMAARLQRAEWLLDGSTQADAAPDLKAVIASNRNFDHVESRARALLVEIESLAS